MKITLICKIKRKKQQIFTFLKLEQRSLYVLYTKILICKVTSKKQSSKNVTKHKESELEYLFYCVPALGQRLRSDFRERPGQTLVRGQEVQHVSS